MILTGILSLTPIFAQGDSLEQRVQTLEQSVQKLKNEQISIDAIKRQAEIAATHSKYNREREDRFLTHIKWGVGIINAAALILIYLLNGMKIESIIDKKMVSLIDEKINPVEKNLEVLKIKLDEEITHTNWKKKTTIKVLGQSKETTREVLELFFIHPLNYLEKNNLKKETLAGVQVLIIDNDDGKIQQNEFDEIRDKIFELNNNVSIFYYGKGHFPDDTNPLQISFANAPAQLYGNLLNLIKFINERKKH